MLFLTFIALTYPLSEEDDFINSINKKQNSWKAGKKWTENKSLEFLASLSGTIDESGNLTGDVLRQFGPLFSDLEEIPRSFDASEKWPLCTSIKRPSDQGNCGGCWALASAAAMTDRVCIASEGNNNVDISSEDLLTCCKSCISKENGCRGGYVKEALIFWHKHGIVSGGPYNSDQGCKPLSEASYLKRGATKCEHTCTNPNYEKSYKDDKYFGGKPIILNRKNIKTIQSEIFRNGPVVSMVKVYRDLKYYQEGVYSYQKGEYTGIYHAVKIIGWGMDAEPYWLVVNSWGKDWGERGLFKIKMGDNECDIEKMVFAKANSTHVYKNSALKTLSNKQVLILIRDQPNYELTAVKEVETLKNCTEMRGDPLPKHFYK